MGSTEEKQFCAWSKTVEECLEEYDVSLEKGLSFQEVEKRRERYGWNELQKETGKPFWILILEQFDDRLVHILLGAALTSFILAYWDKNEIGDEGMTAYVEPLVILLILMLNAIVRVWKESNAEMALEALKEMKCEQAKVLRDGSSIPHLPARELVPGDIVELRVGDKVPADMRIASLQTSTLRMEQSSLTGESHPVFKSTKTVLMDDCELQAKNCMVFAGTTVVNGCCTCIVVSVGMSTEVGKIQVQIQQAALEGDDTPLKKKLHEFGESLTKAIGFVCFLAWIISYKSFLSWDVVDGWPKNIRFSFGKCSYYIKISIALAVATIPVGLPAVITMCLALGTKKMAQMNAIVRKLPSVETLGCTTVICIDKTGTLTTNQMSVTQFITLGHTVNSIQEFHVEGTTYNPTDGGILERPTHMSVNLETLAEIAAICNDAGISSQGHQFHASGMPTEAALKVLVEKMGISSLKAMNIGNGGNANVNHPTENGTVKLVYCNQLIEKSKRLASLDFDRIRKSMGVIVGDLSGQNRLLVKGAMENVLERSAFLQLADGTIVEMDDASRELLSMKLHQMSSKGLRCLGLAYKEDLGEFNDYGGENHPAHMKLLDPANYSEIENDLIFAGLIGLRDSPREEVYEAIKDCREAGIQVMVITGDNKFTTEAVCRDIGIFYEGENLNGKSFTAKEFMELPLNKRCEVLAKPGGCVFSRAEPRHKQDIVLMLKEAGQVIAMTGDGVNDAPALKLADIGIAMGIAGTEVAKEASDMVLADNNFGTIVAAVSEGRSIYNTMKAFIRHMITSNIGEITSIFVTAALGMPDGFIPVQLLWLNLVIDGPPTMALCFNHSDIDIMQKPPRKSNDALINVWAFFRYMVIGTYAGLATVGIFALWFTHDSFLGIDFSADGHTLVAFSQLTSWGECPSWEGFKVSPFLAGGRKFSFDYNPCDYFSNGKAKATTLSLSVLVAIELFNSLNALSEDNSFLTVPPWINPWLMLAMPVSFGLHSLILYVPFLARFFGIVPLSFSEWCLVIVVSFPVILIDEVLKLIRRRMSRGHEKYKTA